MPVRLSTTVKSIATIPNPTNAALLSEFYEYMKTNGTSESYQNGNLKIFIYFARFLGTDAEYYDISKKEQILAFLNTRIKDPTSDPDKRWIRTWNDYLQRIKYFFRWLSNCKQKASKGEEILPNSDWITPAFAQIKEKRTKRLSPYLESELWERDDILTIIKYELYKRNKAALSLLWDLDARNHEVTLLQITQGYMSDENKQRYIAWLEDHNTIIKEHEGRHDAIKTLGCSYYYRYRQGWKDLTDDQRYDKLQEWNQQLCVP